MSRNSFLMARGLSIYRAQGRRIGAVVTEDTSQACCSLLPVELITFKREPLFRA